MSSSSVRASLLLVAATGAAGLAVPACSSEFSDCHTTRTCPAGGKSGAGAAGVTTEAGNSGKSGSPSHSGGPGNEAGSAGVEEPSGGEGGASAPDDDAGAGGTLQTAGSGGNVGSVTAGSGGNGGSVTAGSGGNGGSVTAGSAGNGGSVTAGSGGSVVVDQVPPAILSITPTNGATKLTIATDTIVVTFSEPMNKSSAQSAFVPAGSALTPTFSWNGAGTELSINPNLSYVAATDPAAAAEPFKFSITTAAKDLAGNSLAANVNWQFTLLREITQSFGHSYSDGGNWETGANTTRRTLDTGDYDYGHAVRAFMSFDISALPPGVSVFESAVVSSFVNSVKGDPFGQFGNMLCQSVSYTTMNQAAFDAPPLHDLGIFIATTSNITTYPDISKDVLVALTDDYANRITRNNKSQYRLLFPSAPNSNAMNDFVQLNNSANVTKLTVKYLFP